VKITDRVKANVIKEAVATHGWGRVMQAVQEPLRRRLEYLLVSSKALAPFEETPSEWGHRFRTEVEFQWDPEAVEESYRRFETAQDLAMTQIRAHIDSALVLRLTSEEPPVEVTPAALKDVIGKEGPGTLLTQARGFAELRKRLGEDLDHTVVAEILRTGLVAILYKRQLICSRLVRDPFDLFVMGSPEETGRFAFALEVDHEERKTGIVLKIKTRWTMEGPHNGRHLRILPVR